MKRLSSIVNPSKGRGRLWRMLGLAAAAAVGCVFVSGGAFAADSSHIKTDISIVYQVSTWYIDAGHESGWVDGHGSSNETGIANYLRLNANFKDMNTGVSVHTSINLLGDRWAGNGQGINAPGPGGTPEPGTIPNYTPANDFGNAVYINYAYVQVPLGKTLLRVGRQKANWADCFLVCDSTRDRILLIHPFGSVTGIAGYDRRNDTISFYSPDNSDQAFAAIVGGFGKFHYGFLYVHFFSNNASGSALDGTALSGINVVSPWISGDIGPVHLEGAVNFTNGGDTDLGSVNLPGVVFSKSSWSAYIRAGWHINNTLLLRGQYIQSQDGGVMSSGFDTFSSMINNSPESTNTPTSVFSMGGNNGSVPGAGIGPGLRGLNQRLIIFNLVAQVTPKLSLGGSVGQLHLERCFLFVNSNGSCLSGADDSDSSMVYDFKATYQVNKAVRFWGTLGYLASNKVGTLNGNSLIGGTEDIPQAWDTNNILGASLNMQVKF